MISTYFRKIENHSSLRFILEVSVLAFISRFIIVLPVAITLLVLGVNLGDSNITGLNFSGNYFPVLFYVIIFAPFFETLLFQLLPLNILESIKINKLLQTKIPVAIILTTLIFAYAHLHEGLINFLGMVPIGFLLAWSFKVKQKKSLRRAIVVVFAIHALTNLSAVIMYLLSK